jgi:hypothetical protein
VASSRIRAATAPKFGVAVLSPASVGTRRVSANASAARIIILLGMQP